LSAAAAVAAVALLWLVSEVPGWAIVRAAGLPPDRFTRLWAGLVLMSVVGLALAQAGWFSLVSLLGVIAVVIVASLALGKRVSVAARPRTTRACDLLVGTTALAMVVWSWPPYETVLGASDSTMYVSAGVHLARTGSLSVPDSLVPLLPREASSALFSSVGLFGDGPFIRLPGGLLMPTLEASHATPAFFPLLPVWVAVSALGGGPAAAVLVAPVFTVLALWSVVLFVGETLGLVSAAATACMLLANFAIWWFAKFPMPEPLAMAAVWGGLVVLHRAAVNGDRRTAFLAGAILGLAGMARTETLLFVIAAGVLAWAWTSLRAPLAPLLVGFVLLASVSVLNGALSPSHHLAYLRNDLVLRSVGARIWVRNQPNAARMVGAASGALAVLGMLAAGMVGRRSGVGFVRGLLRLAGPLAIAAALVVYVRVGGVAFVWRDLGWLAAYCSWPLLILAAVGAPLAWRRGGTAMRLAAFAWILATVVFVLNPRVTAYQPWAIRRFVPLVIPGIAIAGGAALAWIAERPRGGARLVALAVGLVVVALEGRSVLPVHGRPYYVGSLALIDTIADRLPVNAIVAMDSAFADVQLQVPLWLIAGRETLMLRRGGQRWRDVMHALLGSGRPVVWIGSPHDTPRDLGDVQLRPSEPDIDLTVVTPDAPADRPPSRTLTRLVPLRIYSVEAATGPTGAAATEAGSASTAWDRFLLPARTPPL
jgi:hypothetical protein